MIDVCLLGTGGMMPLPYRYLTSLMTRIEGHQLLIDCGEGTQIAAKKAGWSTYPVDVICFTHYHADHISGLPGFLLSMGNADRTEPLTLIGPKGLERVVSALRVIAPELPFEIRFRELTEKRETIDLGFVTLEAFRVNHNITCYGYSLVLRRAGKFDADRAKELGLPVQFWGRLQKGETVEYEGAVYTSDMVMGAERRGIKLTYCTDTRPSSGVSAAAAGADLFICEGMYGEREKDKKAREYKHMTMYDAAKLAKDAGAGELWLTHYSPSMNRPGDYIDAVQEIFPQAVCGKDGMSTTLRFRD
ncbi:MAG: ribonuclease Z [Lachnospiraceae bacterium]|nr:ribonuclease Z [Lachnospiraceae bacterium]MBQ4308270.1 ribonuclease Z [Lachnospiraceae bacterium]MBR0402877.1 ribonuclease Z [Lachnospiraceae bacterium]MBR2738106.1 ribonuclease Z [Lachnospiraceae bacterium]MCR5539123.1 ribonuclease Z [Lachnospiraceae bacterium]